MPSLQAPLRDQVAQRLRQVLPGANLHDLAGRYGVTIHKNGRLNKGWVGLTIERAGGLAISNRQSSDGADFELKSTTLVQGESGWKPKETIRITQLTPRRMLSEEFERSALWNKLSRLIVVGCAHESAALVSVVRVSTVDITDPELVGGIRDFWQDVQHSLQEGEIADFPYQGTSNDWIQLRPTGDGRGVSRCPITGRRFPSQAFYGTKRLLERILGLTS